MSSTTPTQSNDLSESDSEDSCQTLRPYNTRSGRLLNRRRPNVKKTVNKQLSSAKRGNRSKSSDRESPVFQYLRPFTAQSDQTPDEMDYNFDPCPPRQASQGRCCQIASTLLCLGLLSGFTFLVWSLYVMHDQLEKLGNDLVELKGGKKEDPYAKLSKELNKKCIDTLKLLIHDPVGRPDFALESSGGSIINVDASPYIDSSSKLLGFTLCEGSHSASAMIRATSGPGECWAFKGETGSAIIQLIGHVKIDAITLEHIPASISPSGTIDSAPQSFKLWGLTLPNRNTRQLLGEFKFENDGTTLQTFKINNTNYYKYVEFQVVSNHGNKDYTCVYRLRVHGTLRRQYG